MVVPQIFNTVEQSAFSTWIRESPSLFAFYFILLFHTIGLSFVVGANTVVDLRLLGVARALPLKTRAARAPCQGEHPQIGWGGPNAKPRPHPLRCQRQFFPMPAR